jgi:transcriptional regulator with XRE-family HTH domain
MSISLATPRDLCRKLAAQAKEARLAANLTRAGLAERAGVSLSSLRRFESVGAASFELVVRVAFALKFEEGLAEMFMPRKFATLDDALKTTPRRQRGRRR